MGRRGLNQPLLRSVKNYEHRWKEPVKFIKSLVIRLAPQGLLKLLRCYRPVSEWCMFVIYSICGKEAYYPIFLKFKSKSTTGFPIRNSDSERDRWGEAFCLYNSRVGAEKIPLMWADGPMPGNYGDWLSPYIVTRFLGVNVVHVSEVLANKKKHLVALGSILSLANRHSVVVGAGVSSYKESVDANAVLVSIRGPYTNSHITKTVGKKCDRFGDIGFLLRRIYVPEAAERRGILVVRHIQHQKIKIRLDSDFREISINRARPDDIERFISELHEAEFVATSAMHCFITCISYSIPCVLFSMGDWKSSVPGDGVKYKDSLAGVNLPEVEPLYISNGENFCKLIREAAPYRYSVSDASLDSIEESLKLAVSFLRSGHVEYEQA